MLNREIRLLSTGVLLLLCLGCGAGSVAFREGRKAELRKDYDTALVHFDKALQSQPDNAEILLHEKLARKEGSLFHLKQGRRFLEQGRSDDAAGEFQKAVSMDPSNQAASQELARVLAMQAAAKRARDGALQQALKAREEAAAPRVTKLKPFPSEPLAHLRISADSKKVFETLAKLADLNVAFTQDFQARPLSLDLTNIKIEDAMRVAALQTKTFWKAITPNTIVIIPDTPSNRRDYEEDVLKTIYLSNPLKPADRTAITTALKQVIGIQRIIDNPDSNAIVVRDTPARVEAAEKLIRDLDRGKAEVMVDVAIIEADRGRIRDLGLTPAFLSAQGALTAGANMGIAFNPQSGNVSPTGAPPTFALNKLRLYSGDYSLTLPSAIATALLNDTHTRVLQNPQVRVTDGETAKLRIGSRYPYATGSFLPGVGGIGTGGGAGGFNLLASTQFQYQDIGVNLDLTPHLLASGEVSLHATIEISSVQAPVNIGGLQEPIFGQRKIEHDIRLKEGEMSLLGGLIQSQVTRTVTGVPGLGQIPLLRYLFTTEHSDREDVEVLVMLTPRVIRLPESRVEGGKDLPLAPGPQGPALPEAGPLPEPGPPPPGPPQ
jgi:general secretion pathway protein D